MKRGIWILGLLVLLVGCSSSSETSDDKTSERLSIGEDGILFVESSNDIALGITKDDYKKFVQVVLARDDFGLSEMIISEELFLVKSGTKIRVIGIGFGVRQVRILEGEHIGKSGWLAYERVIPENTE